MGWEAGRSLTSGNNNVCLGPMAGRSLGGGTYNIALGYHSLSNVGSPTRCIGIARRMGTKPVKMHAQNTRCDETRCQCSRTL